MIEQELRKIGDEYVVAIPSEEVERRGLREGQLLAVEVHPIDRRPLPSEPSSARRREGSRSDLDAIVRAEEVVARTAGALRSREPIVPPTRDEIEAAIADDVVERMGG